MTLALGIQPTCFTITVEDGVAHIVLDQPDRLNVMNRAFWNELPLIVGEISDRALARCILISSTGRHFTAGMDLTVFEGDGLGLPGGSPVDRATAMEADLHFIRNVQKTCSSLAEARMPVVCAIQGGCVGGGLDLVSAADIRYAAADAFFVLQETNIGMTADAGTFPRLCGIIPDGWAREMAFTGRRLSAQRAREIGLVNEVFETHEALLARALETARLIASKSPLAVAGSKVMINYAKDHTTSDALDYIAVWQTGMFSLEHVAETAAAAREKRSPRFPDLLPVRRQM